MKHAWFDDIRSPDFNRMLAEWLSQELFGHSGAFRLSPYTTLGIVEGDELQAVVLYNNWHNGTGTIEVHAASKTARWLTRPVLWEMFDYPFNQLGCQNVIMRVSEHDTRLLRILTAYGFDNVTIPRLRGRDEGERIFWLTDDAWRANGFHKENADGQARRAKAA